MPESPDVPHKTDERRFLRLVDTLDHAVVWEFDDTQGQYTFVSQHSRMVLGYPAEDWLGDPRFFEKRVHPEDLAKLQELLDKLRRKEASDLRCEHRCVKQDGQLVWVHTGVHYEEEDGHCLFRGVTIDINHIKAAEERERLAREEAERAGRARDEVLAVVAHDLRNPLSTIRLACDVLEASALQRRQLEMIRRATRRMQGLIDDLVDAASIRAARLSITVTEIDSAKLVREIAEDFAAEAVEKNLAVVVDVQSAVSVRCDARRIAQALSNLVNNALKFTDAGGTVTLRVAADDLHARFVVEDTGRGIAQDEIDKVFDRAWQSDETAHLGSGMGLYIAKGVVEDHGGEIRVASTLGQGSVFTFLLPLG
jgi:PAS domain S-box-containing protein